MRVTLRDAERRVSVPKGKRLRLAATGMVELPVGEWLPPSDQPEPRHLGYLLLRGLIVREVCIAGAWSVELLDRGDLLRPWMEDAASFVDAYWRVLEPASLIPLDERITGAGDCGDLIEELVDRAMRRSRSMAVHAAISATRRVGDRLLLLLWHVAERRGHRSPDGVQIHLPVTHETLAHLVGARRPSVTTALRRLEDRQLLARPGPGEWVLRGEPPGAPR
jgi:CRP/FNR family transcriptional regulator, cyclic AMP receptor protein